MNNVPVESWYHQRAIESARARQTEGGSKRVGTPLTGPSTCSHFIMPCLISTQAQSHRLMTVARAEVIESKEREEERGAAREGLSLRSPLRVHGVRESSAVRFAEDDAKKDTWTCKAWESVHLYFGVVSRSRKERERKKETTRSIFLAECYLEAVEYDRASETLQGKARSAQKRRQWLTAFATRGQFAEIFASTKKFSHSGGIDPFPVCIGDAGMRR